MSPSRTVDQCGLMPSRFGGGTVADGTVQRRLAAILAADVAGFSALMERDEEGTYSRIGNLRREVIEPRLSEHQGRLIKATGDGFLAEFASPIAALRCALAIQSAQPDDPNALRLRIGLNLGDVIIEQGGDVYGEGVNIAARLEGLADPGGILISGKIHTEVEGKVTADFEDLGEQQVKNITRPVRIYSVRSATAVGKAGSKTAAIDNLGLLARPDKPSIAVLPFQNMSGDPEQEYFADGMVEEITTALSRFNSLFVIARNSSFTYKGKAVDIKQVGRELGVRYVLEGSVRKAGGRVRITSQLIEATSGTHLWADKIEGLLDDVFELQDKVTSSVVGVIAPKIEAAEIERATRKPTENLEAYDWYLRAEAAFDHWTRDASDDAIWMLKKAIELDPNCAAAMARIAGTYNIRWQQGWMRDPKTEVADALSYARLSLESGKNDAEVLSRSALTVASFAGELDTGNALADLALSLNPNEDWAWFASGWIKLWLGHHRLSVEHFMRAMQVNPFDKLNFITKSGLALAYFLVGEFENAQTWGKKSQLDNANYIPCLRTSAAVHAALGQFRHAREIVDHILELDQNHKISTALVMRLARRSEDRDKLFQFLRLAGLPE
jgi:adenylate cyclase